MTSVMIHSRIDATTRDTAEKALLAMGLTLSDGIRIFLTKVSLERRIPFELAAPNPTTLEAMAEAQEILKNKKARFTSSKELIDDLKKNS